MMGTYPWKSCGGGKEERRWVVGVREGRRYVMFVGGEKSRRGAAIEKAGAGSHKFKRLVLIRIGLQFPYSD
jgi:hypothetical protein